MPRGAKSARADHAATTRQALVDAALNLFSSRGYDDTKTEDIAEAAGVSPRTFFRYFPTKESVLFFGEYDFIRSFTGLYLSQPESMSEFDAICASFATLAPGVGRLRDRIKLYYRAIASSPALRGRERLSHEENVVTVAGAIAERRGLLRPDSSCELLAAVGLVVLEHAMSRWVAGPVRPGLGEVIEAEFETLRDLVSPGCAVNAGADAR
jgi:AcrR family transcriptional regulator